MPRTSVNFDPSFLFKLADRDKANKEKKKREEEEKRTKELLEKKLRENRPDLKDEDIELALLTGQVPPEPKKDILEKGQERTPEGMAKLISGKAKPSPEIDQDIGKRVKTEPVNPIGEQTAVADKRGKVAKPDIIKKPGFPKSLFEEAERPEEKTGKGIAAKARATGTEQRPSGLRTGDLASAQRETDFQKKSFFEPVEDVKGMSRVMNIPADERQRMAKKDERLKQQIQSEKTNKALELSNLTPMAKALLEAGIYTEKEAVNASQPKEYKPKEPPDITKTDEYKQAILNIAAQKKDDPEFVKSTLNKYVQQQMIGADVPADAHYMAEGSRYPRMNPDGTPRVDKTTGSQQYGEVPYNSIMYTDQSGAQVFQKVSGSSFFDFMNQEAANAARREVNKVAGVTTIDEIQDISSEITGLSQELQSLEKELQQLESEFK